MHYVFDRNTLQLEGAFTKVPEGYLCEGFLVLPKGIDQDQFRKALDMNHVSCLEIALMYRNAGDITGPISDFRDSLISALYYLLIDGRYLTKHTVTLFSEKIEPQQVRIGPDRRGVNTVAPTRASGVRAIIWDHADKVWSAAGSPSDKATVLALRKQMMAELENQGVKRTSSSNELGNWMKTRIPV